VAGPGSGKTRVLTSRIAHLHLHHDIAPESIYAVTFTDRAAHEIKNRLVSLLGHSTAKKVVVGTFHSVCQQIIRMHPERCGLEKDFTVCDTKDRYVVFDFVDCPTVLVDSLFST
jgi:DNA helicase-2/ATP-dependent DNA helicase PcrA